MYRRQKNHLEMWWKFNKCTDVKFPHNELTVPWIGQMKWRSGVRNSNDRCIQDQGDCSRTLYIHVTPITFLSQYTHSSLPMNQIIYYSSLPSDSILKFNPQYPHDNFLWAGCIGSLRNGLQQEAVLTNWAGFVSFCVRNQAARWYFAPTLPNQSLIS